jgi:hypothetical protein
MSRAAKPRPKSQKKRAAPKRKLPVPALGLSVDQFCAANNIGRDLFYELVRQKRGPDCMRLGRRRIITIDAAARWQREREAESAAA